MGESKKRNSRKITTKVPSKNSSRNKFFKELCGERFNFFKEIKTYTHKHPFVKFSVIVLIFTIYFFISLEKYGFKEGMLTGILTWSFFVFCTPIADAGILVDFPVRLLTGLRMLYSEIIVWVIATIVNIYAMFFYSSIYQNNILLRIFQEIIRKPFPYAIIIILSAGGTFFSILFGDEILDVISEKKSDHNHRKKHKNTHKILITVFILVAIIILYYILIKKLGINF